MAYQTDKLKARIIEKFGDQRKFAQAIGISEPTLSKYLSTGRDWKGSSIIKAIRALEIPDNEVDAYFFVPAVSKSKPRKT